MAKINAVITGVGGYVPDYILTNEELSRMVDTSDEWIQTRVGIKERRILKEEGLGASYMARKACKQLLKKTGADPDSIDALLVSTTTPDYPFPSTASIVVGKLGLKNAFAFDMSCACCGFIYALDMATSMIQSGRYKKVIVCSAEKMSSIVDWTDRQTCVLFGDGAGAVLLEATEEEGVGFQDSLLLTDGKGLPFLHMKAGGSVCPATHFTIDNHLHYVYQEGRTVFRHAVTYMSDDVATVMERNGLDSSNLNWIIPHEANLRIIDAVAKRANLPLDKVVINIDHYGNTSSATIPLALWDNEANFKKGDNIIFTAFGAGFVHGAIYLKWGYDGSKVGQGE
ncbi:3-oxoacyl-[acyl-carrier-protein] synthase 3 protein 2 [Hallella multisaccharivorax DSM 17128]|uniref:Beta-ketoacyl-[acyl-carrier-protein] synthase III n=1 Tax=Hallella multisaccharivorax DSM 17128 TaxID=688246 RepID=F8N7P7_9BACT|nr:beta-ketoacyl-ACP synthase III [Hallella multisaccharivorax]EGN56402.1 3-oxoacyl-(acyl-carrier-protein) synthase III [Hallella multisaccharivorax DSM 17128]GJG29927.1 3-oxoacyl-[acyl-carrier-protein] synthase 3 protein 2 [Hallella multisaccharivorax DSM 17128]